MSEKEKPSFWLGWFVPTFFIALGFAIFLVTRDSVIPDTDALYHIGHALSYRDNGLHSSAFPWASASVIGAIGGDLWYGFHLLLIPIVAIKSDPALALPLAQAWVILLGYFALAYAFREADVPGALLWPLLVFAGNEYGPWRAMMTRPGVISLGLLLIVIVALARGRPWAAGVAAFCFAFIHLTVAWLILVVMGLVLAFQWMGKEKPLVSSMFAGFAGSAMGAFARPHPFGTFELLKIQLIDVAQLLHHEPPLRFGIEVTEPVSTQTLIAIAWPLIAVWLTAIVFGLVRWRSPEFARNRTIWGICALVSIAFLALTLAQSARTIELWTATTVAMIALTWEPVFARRPSWSWAAATLPLAIIGWNLFAGAAIIHRYGRNPLALRPAAEWLRTNAQPNAVAFHPLWEDFPGLFAYNRDQRFIGGMDPVFQFRYDEEKYWIAHWMCEDRATHDVATTKDGFDGRIEPMASALRNRFHAEYLVIPVPRLGSLSQHLNGQPDFKLMGIFGQTAIYRILPATAEE